MLFDIHTHHFPPKSFPVICNLTFGMAEKALSTENNYLFSIGIHPWDVDEYSEDKIYQLKNWLCDKRIIAIGECGLDKYAKASLSAQEQIFIQQINLSEETEKPLIIHCVGCFNELLAIRKQFQPKQQWIIHGFRGKSQLAEQLLHADCALSFGEKLNEESVRTTPLNRLFVETDESDKTIDEIYRQIAKIKGCVVGDLSAGKRWFYQITEK